MQNNDNHATDKSPSYFTTLIETKIITKAFIVISEGCFFAEFPRGLALIRWTLSSCIRSDIDDTIIAITIRFTVTAEYNFFDLET